MPDAPSQSLSPESPRLHTVQTVPGRPPRHLWRSRRPGPAAAALSGRCARQAQTLRTARSALWGRRAAHSDRNCHTQPPRRTAARLGLHPPRWRPGPQTTPGHACIKRRKRQRRVKVHQRQINTATLTASTIFEHLLYVRLSTESFTYFITPSPHLSPFRQKFTKNANEAQRS